MRAGLRLADRYRLDSLLGRGGMGEVWRGLDERLGRSVAVKILTAPARADARLISRFRREAEIMARLRDPGIIVVHDVGEDGHLLFLVMELLDGEDLSAVLKRHPRGLPADRARRLAAGIADALHAAHRQGVVHRDVKPANVMVRPGDRVTVMDFGIARYADQVTELTGSAILGTPAYMAPEQFEKGHEPTPQTDLYALGGVLFALLTGRKPFNEDSLRALIREIVLTDPPRPRDVRSDVPADLDELAHALLAKDPRDRPPDARAVAERLRATPAPQRPAARPSAPGRASVPEPEPPPASSPPPGQETRPVVEAPTVRAPSAIAGDQPSPISLRAWLLTAAGILAVITGGGFLLQNPMGLWVDDGKYSALPACDRLPTPSIPDAKVSLTRSPQGTKDALECTWSTLPKDFADRGSISVAFKRYGKKNWKSGGDTAHAALMSARGGDFLPGIGDEGHYIAPPSDFDEPQLMMRVDNLTADISISDSEQQDVTEKNEAAYAKQLAAALLRKPAR